MEKVKLTSLQKRVLTSLVMIPLVIGALRCGHPYVDILVYLVGVMLSWEWSSMVPNKRANVYAVCYAFALGCSLIVFNRAVFFLALAAITIFIYWKAKDEEHRYLITLGAPYISIGVGALYWMYYLFDSFGSFPGEKGSFIMTLWFILMVWSVDIGGYAIGPIFKGPKLAPKISPHKTWSGLFGGVILAIAASLIFYWCVSFSIPLPPGEQFKYAQFGAFVAIIAQIGDLVESAIKRHLNIKDSSALIPGHGGVFDRIDGLIFAAPIIYCYFALVS